jgi:hypothetical protein
MNDYVEETYDKNRLLLSPNPLMSISLASELLNKIGEVSEPNEEDIVTVTIKKKEEVTTKQVKESPEELLKRQMGDIFTIAKPVGDLWKPKGNTIFIRQNKERAGFIASMREKSFVEQIQEAGNNVYKVTVKADSLKLRDVVPTKEPKPEVKRTLTEEEIKIPEKQRYYFRLTGTKNEYTREDAPFVVTKGEPVFIQKGLRTYINKDEQGYKITELETGLALGKSGKTKEEAIANVKEQLEKVVKEEPKQLADLLKKYTQVAKDIGYPYPSYISDKSKIFDDFVVKMPKKVLKKDYSNYNTTEKKLGQLRSSLDNHH